MRIFLFLLISSFLNAQEPFTPGITVDYNLTSAVSFDKENTAVSFAGGLTFTIDHSDEIDYRIGLNVRGFDFHFALENSCGFTYHSLYSFVYLQMVKKNKLDELNSMPGNNVGFGASFRIPVKGEGWIELGYMRSLYSHIPHSAINFINIGIVRPL